MKLADSAGEWLRLSEHYRKLTDEELLTLARRPSSLTDDAQRVLRNEMSARRLALPPEEPPTEEHPVYVEPDPDSLYAEERELVEICTVWSLRDALQVQKILDVAGIPFYMGKEKATGVDPGTFNFSEGVPVAVMQVALPWIRGPMENYHPADEPAEVREESPDIPVTCPKCHSEDVIFERRDPEPKTRAEDFTSKFNWACESCGHRWKDDGVVKDK
jgi:DNA-directed RNA polymerase subunit M/transcription elongation factor TFIIS